MRREVRINLGFPPKITFNGEPAEFSDQVHELME